MGIFRGWLNLFSGVLALIVATTKEDTAFGVIVFLVFALVNFLFAVVVLDERYSN